VEIVELGTRRHHQLPGRLGVAGGHLGDQLRCTHTDGAREAQSDPNRLPHALCHGRRALEEETETRDVHERLVHGDLLEAWSELLEQREDVVRRGGVGLVIGGNDHRLGAEPTRL
jgi:hypothetical protein